MDANFWHQRWKDNDIGWHERDGNALLAKHFETISTEQAQRVLVPLCGKTRDIGWLLAQGCEVVGVELDETAVQQLFYELGVTPAISKVGALKHYSAEISFKNSAQENAKESAINLTVFVGDFFQLETKQVGRIDAVFDRASMVALPEDMRIPYTARLSKITGNARQLLVVFEYSQAEMDGPPFSISLRDISRYYQGLYSVALLSHVDVTGKLRGDFAASENAYFLQPLRSGI